MTSARLLGRGALVLIVVALLAVGTTACNPIGQSAATVEGHDIHKMSDHKRSSYRAESMGFIFQAFNLIPVFTASENVEFGSPAISP